MFNLALLGKWWWRMMSDKEGLWYRVLKARYGELGGLLQEGGMHSSSWWRMLCRVREGVGRWFDNNIKRVMGDGRDTLFWYETWVGEILCTVEEMWRLGCGDGGEGWRWRRRLLA